MENKNKKNYACTECGSIDTEQRTISHYEEEEPHRARYIRKCWGCGNSYYAYGEE